MFGLDAVSRAKNAYENAKDDAEKAAKKTEYIAALEEALANETDITKKTELETTLSGLRAAGGRRRKRKGGSHTKKHRKSGKKSRRARSGR